jgi:hypothetical protein
VSQSNVGTHPHTPHESCPAIIHYRHHPFHGEPIAIVRRLRRYTTDCVVIALADDVQVAVPTWMLDPLACQQLTDEARPRIAVSALRDLRALVDSQPLTAVALAINRGTVPPIGGEDARPDGTSTAPANAGLCQSRPVADAPGPGSTPVPIPLRTTAARGAARRRTAKERR